MMINGFWMADLPRPTLSPIPLLHAPGLGCEYARCSEAQLYAAGAATLTWRKIVPWSTDAPGVHEWLMASGAEWFIVDRTNNVLYCLMFSNI